MRDHEIENKLAAYVQQATPDVLDSVLQQCDEQEGRVLPMSDIQQMNNHTKKRSWLVALSTAAAVFILALFIKIPALEVFLDSKIIGL